LYKNFGMGRAVVQVPWKICGCHVVSRVKFVLKRDVKPQLTGASTVWGHGVRCILSYHYGPLLLVWHQSWQDRGFRPHPWCWLWRVSCFFGWQIYVQMLHLLWTLFQILSEGESTFRIHSETLRSFLLQHIDLIDKLAKGRGQVLRDSYVARERTEGTTKHIILCVCTSNWYPHNFHRCLMHSWRL